MSNRKTLFVGALALAGAFFTAGAQAGNVQWSVGVNLPPVTTVVSNGPVYAAPVYAPPVVYEPAPVYVEPAPVVVYRPRPVYRPYPVVYRPYPVYRPAPVVVVPAPYHGGYYHGGYHGHGWHGDHHR